MNTFVQTEGYSLGIIDKNSYDRLQNYLNGEAALKTTTIDDVTYLIDTLYPNTDFENLENDGKYFIKQWNWADRSLELNNDLVIRIWSPIIDSHRGRTFFTSMSKSQNVFYAGNIYVVVAYTDDIWWKYQPLSSSREQIMLSHKNDPTPSSHNI